VDTNVAIVANGHPAEGDARAPSIDCRLAAVTFLAGLVENGVVLLDAAGAIQTEYRRHLNPRGQPGVGDRFYQVVLHSSPALVERLDLPQREDGEYADLPDELIAVNFDPSDRKFAAMAKRYGVPVYNTTDSDWVNDAAALAAAQIEVRNLCGGDTTEWFTT
jgi:hypothetical protein